MNDVSKQIYQTFHPIVVENFLKTLHTIFKSSKHHSLIISSIHFRAGNDLRCLLDWLRSLIDTGKVVPITLNREEPKRDNLKDKLTLAYTNYWKYKNCSVTHKGEANLSKINEPKLKEIIHGLVSSAPLDVTTDIIDSLKKITNVPPTTRSKGKIINPEDIDQFFLNIIERHQTHLPRIYPLLHLLDIPAPTNMKAQILLTELDKASEKDIKTLSSLLNR